MSPKAAEYAARCVTSAKEEAMGFTSARPILPLHGAIQPDLDDGHWRLLSLSFSTTPAWHTAMPFCDCPPHLQPPGRPLSNERID
jgi:hypothetical protein